MELIGSAKKTGRIAGLLYLVVIVTGIFSLAYVPKKLFVWDDPTVTFNNIVSSELLFRLSIVSSVLCYTAFIFLPLALYKLLRLVNNTAAISMVILAIISVPVSLINLQNKFSVLNLISRDKYLNIYSAGQLESQVLFYLNQYDSGILIAMVFWGLWLFPFGYLVYRSGFLPKFLGVLLMLGCFGYLINFTGNVLLNNYTQMGIAKYVSMPATLGEIGICIWLLIGRTRKPREPLA